MCTGMNHMNLIFCKKIKNMNPLNKANDINLLTSGEYDRIISMKSTWVYIKAWRCTGLLSIRSTIDQ